MVTVADCTAPPSLPVTVANVCAETAVVFTINVADAWFAATVSETGTVADFELDDRVTTTPPTPAGLLKITDPVTDEPPVIAEGVRVTDESDGG